MHCTYPNGVKMHFLSSRLAKGEKAKYRTRWSDHGTTFFGTEGWISVDRGGIEYSTPALGKVKLGPNDTPLYASPAHDRNFLDCIKSRQQAISPVEAAIRSDTISHLSQLVVRTGQTIEWDPFTETASDPFIQSILDRPQRGAYRI